MDEINIRFVNIMKALGLSSYKLSRELGTSEAVLSNIKNGRNKPSTDIVEKILNKYEVINSNYLLRGLGAVLIDNNVNPSVNPDVHLFPNVHAKSVHKTENKNKEQSEVSIISKTLEQYSKKFTFNIEDVIVRLKELTACQSDVELAEVFNVRSGTVSAWRKRNTINFEELVKLAYLNKWDLNYVLLGIVQSKIINPKISMSSTSNVKHIAALTKQVHEGELEIVSLKGQLNLMKGLLDTYIKSR